MKAHIFRGDGRVFGFTRDEAGASLPSGYGDRAAFRSVEMRDGDAMPGVEADECLADIEAHGFHLTDAHVRITDRAIGEETL